MKKLKRYKPTMFKAKDSHYDKEAADFAVAFIENLCHTKGTWAGRPFELLDWQEQIIRDLFGILKPNGYRQFNTAYFFKFNVEGLLRGDYQSRMNGYATARQNGWMSANDIRELENLDRIPAEEGGDLYLINGNMLPLVHAGAFADIDSGKEETEPDEFPEEVLEVEKSGRRRTGSKGP